MTAPGKTRKSTTHSAEVLSRDWLTPKMVRLVLGGDGLADFAAGDFTDHYLKLCFPAPGYEGLDLSDIGAVRDSLPREAWPCTRTYTVRRWNEFAAELTIDFVHHSDHGVAGPWAATVPLGERIFFMGPGGGYAPNPLADWHLLAGDESALPAIAAALEQMPPASTAKVFVEIADVVEAQPLEPTCAAEIHWLPRGHRPVGELLVERLTRFQHPAGRVHGFVHGEANFVKQLRRHLHVDRRIPREQLSISGYWRRGLDEDGWQSAKGVWNERVEQEESLALASGRA